MTKQKKKSKQKKRETNGGDDALAKQAALDEARRKRHWATLRAKAADEVRKEDERQHLHRRLQNALTRLEKREQRKANENPAVAELVEDIKALPRRFERWLAPMRSRLL